MVISQTLGLESYVEGHSPSSVSIHADPISWVVVAYNRISRRTVAGYFENPEESEQFRAMQLPVSEDDDLNGLEVRLLCMTPDKDSVTEETLLRQMSNERYLMAIFEGCGIPSQRVNLRYARGSKLVLINMSTGGLHVRNVLGDDRQLPEPANMPLADPAEPTYNESHDPPEPNEKRFWRRAAGA